VLLEIKTEQFGIRHWGIALLMAIVAHLSLFTSFHWSTGSGIKETASKGILIKLKNYSFPSLNESTKIEPEQNKEIKKPVPPSPKLMPKPKPVPEVIPAPVPAAEKQATPEPMQEPIDESISNGPSPAHNSEQAGPDASLEQKYQAKLLTWLERYKHYPTIARRRGEQGVVVLRFVIDEDGNLLSHDLLEISMHESLNRAVKRMIKRATPLPPVPIQLRGRNSKYSYVLPIHFVIR